MGGMVQIFRENLNKSNSITEELRSRLKTWNVCCHSVQNLLPSSLLSKNIKNKLHTIIMPMILYVCVILP